MKKDKNMDETLIGKVYCKLRQGVITNCDRYVITNCDKFYYKLRQVLQIATTVIINCDRYYKLGRYYKLRQYSRFPIF